MNRNSLIRSAVPIAMLLAAAIFLHARSRPEPQVPRHPVADFPHSVSGWQSKDMPISQEVRDVLGAGDFLSRVYFRPEQPYVDFFVAYFPSQRSGNSIHSPKNCLPGAGWMPTESGTITVPRENNGAVTVNRYVISKGLDKQVVLYWYQAHGRIVASEYWAKYFLVADSIRTGRSDGSLVRVVTPVTPRETMDSAQARALEFARVALGNLDPVIPR